MEHIEHIEKLDQDRTNINLEINDSQDNNYIWNINDLDSNKDIDKNSEEEYNNVEENKYIQHMKEYGYKLHYKNFCNLIFVK